MNSTNRARMLAVGATFVIIAAVIAGLFAIGSPGLQRDRKLDQRRISGLSLISRQVALYWETNKKLPPDIDAIAKHPGLRIPSDPKNSTAYEYAPTGEMTFKVCAVFALDTAADSNASYYQTNEKWLHGAGHTCFSRSVDKMLDDD